MYFALLLKTGNDCAGMMPEELVRTALYEAHKRWGGNIVDFHGFELPIWYSSMMEEHLNTRENAGLFDVSHMGFFRFSGDGVREWLQSIATQRVEHLQPGRCAYTHFLDADGVIIDDMIFAVTDRQTIIETGCIDWQHPSDIVILGVPNASMIPVMKDWFDSHLPKDGSVVLEDLSDDTSILALQGPKSPQIIEAVLGVENAIKHFSGKAISENEFGITGWIQATGYTGERGFEIFVNNNQAETLWEALLSGGKQFGISPVGLGARDTLRMEKGFLLSGQDFHWPGLGDDEESSVDSSFLARDSFETNVPFGLDLDHDFIGKSRVETSIESRDQRWWGIKYLDRGPFPRTGSKVLDTEGNEIGIITSGGPSPSLGKVGIGLGYITGVEPGDEVLIAPNPRKQILAVVVRPPFI
jgi:aminomethyltransferase